MDIPFVFSSNGDGFGFHARTGISPTPEVTLTLDQFPSPADLWARYRAWKCLSDAESAVALHDYFDDGSGKCGYLQALETGQHVKAGVGRWITFYNHQLPHTAHGGQPPAVVHFSAMETVHQVQALA